MRWILLCLFLLSAELNYAQNIFEYEQPIELSNDYRSLEITSTNSEDRILIEGTLLYPASDFTKVVLIVPGSGKDTRHSHFKLAEEFLKNQFAVFRFDERGIGKSGGKYNYTASSLQKDIIAVYHQLRRTDLLHNKKIGILGHSLGGIASIGAFGKGCDFDFLIQMGTPAENNGAFIEYQALTNIDGFYTVKNKTTEEVIQFINALRKTVRPNDDFNCTKKRSKSVVKKMGFRKGRHIVNPLLIDLMQQNHEQTYQSSKAPILYIIGSRDRIVSSSNEIQVLEKLNNPLVTISLIPDVNHWLNDQIGPTKMSRSLYDMNKKAMKKIIEWILER